LQIAARCADAWNVDYVKPEDFGRKLAILKDHCRDLGRDPESIAPSYFGLISVNRDPDKVVRVLSPNLPQNAYVLNGTPDEVIDQMREFRDLGARHIQLSFVDYPSTDGVETFLEDVWPEIKE
jgi:alkanesulfonate monooxygenase SsuD/methylene tetrahydromethanopterin reductase-like flavin-dependent oxidoreductase (luciferase family)